MAKWTLEEDKKLRENLGNYTYQELSKLLNRSYSSVGKRIERLGLTHTVTKKEQVTEAKQGRSELYAEIFDGFKNVFLNYKPTLEPIKTLENYSKNKKVEIANLIISDVHLGKLNKIYYPPVQREIETYNDAIFKKMFKRFYNSILEIYTLQKQSYYYEQLNIYLLGDLIDGDGYVFEGQEFKVTKVVGQQMWDAIFDFHFLIRELTKLYPKINVFGLVGNHSMPSTNRKADIPVENYLEYHIYKTLKTMFELEKNKKVNFVVPTSRYYSTKVYNHMIYMTHGDETGGGAKTTRIRKAKDTYINLPEEKYDVYLLGHFHSLEKDPIGDKGVLMTNGAWIPFDDYARKLYGIYTEPKQWFFSSNKTRPITWAFEVDFKGTKLSEGLIL